MKKRPLIKHERWCHHIWACGVSPYVTDTNVAKYNRMIRIREAINVIFKRAYKKLIDCMRYSTIPTDLNLYCILPYLDLFCKWENIEWLQNKK